MADGPYSFDITSSDGRPGRFTRRIERRLSSMRGQYADPDAYAAALEAGDVELYEVFELERPAVAGEIAHGISIVHPGKIGDEYFMTKGHFHAVLDTAEFYQCLAGNGFMVMETPEGDWAVEAMRPGVVIYIPPRWGHRSVNTGRAADLIMFFGYPANAGHDYGSIERQGFRKLVIERDGEPAIVDNPRWLSPGAR